MKRYQLKFVFRGVSPMIWRRLFIPEQTSLEVLHQVIQIIYHWDNDYLYQFHIHGQDYGRFHRLIATIPGKSYYGISFNSNISMPLFIYFFSFDIIEGVLLRLISILKFQLNKKRL